MVSLHLAVREPEYPQLTVPYLKWLLQRVYGPIACTNKSNKARPARPSRNLADRKDNLAHCTVQQGSTVGRRGTTAASKRRGIVEMVGGEQVEGKRDGGCVKQIGTKELKPKDRARRVTQARRVKRALWLRCFCERVRNGDDMPN